MNDTSQLIDALSADAAPVSPLTSPVRLSVYLALACAAYVAVLLTVQGTRADLLLQMQRPLFMAELVGLVAMIGSSLVAAAYMRFPDQYQQRSVLRYTWLSVAFFVTIFALSFLVPADPRMALAHITHGFECAPCLYGLLEAAIMPSLVMLFILRRSRGSVPRALGFVAALLAAATAGLVLRLAEAADLPLHLLLWHYLPTFVLAALGAVAGKYLLRW